MSGSQRCPRGSPQGQGRELMGNFPPQAENRAYPRAFAGGMGNQGMLEPERLWQRPLIEPLVQPSVPQNAGYPRAFAGGMGNQGILQPERLWDQNLVQPLVSPPTPENSPCPRAFAGGMGNQGMMQPERLWEPQQAQPQRAPSPRVEPQQVQPQRVQPQRVQPQQVQPQRAQGQRAPPQRVQPQQPQPCPSVQPEHSRVEEMRQFFQAQYGSQSREPERCHYGQRLTGFENILGPYDPENPFGYESYQAPTWPPPPQEAITGCDLSFIYPNVIPEEEPSDREFEEQREFGNTVGFVCQKYGLRTKEEFENKMKTLRRVRRRPNQQNPPGGSQNPPGCQ